VEAHRAQKEKAGTTSRDDRPSPISLLCVSAAALSRGAGGERSNYPAWPEADALA
jgi:hypothetical protein